MSVITKINDSATLRDYIKNSISKEEVTKILNYIVSRDNIDKFRFLLEAKNFYPEKDKTKVVEDKYKYDLILFLILREVITIDEILDENNEIAPGYSIKALESAAVFELGLYNRPSDSTSMTDLKRNFFYKNQLHLYHGKQGILSYKDEENIKNEFEKILFDQLISFYSVDSRIERDFLNILNKNDSTEEDMETLENKLKDYFIEDLEVIIGKKIPYSSLYKLFLKINDNVPEIYKENIGIFNFLLNYSDLNNLDFSKTDTLSYFNGGLALNKFYHKRVRETMDSNKDKYERVSNVILNLQRELKNRTINYNE